MNTIEKLLTPVEVCDIINLKRSKVHRLITSGEIPSLIVSQGVRRRTFRIRPSDLISWMKAREVRDAE
jgi:excisionase family DNA binding protein